MPVTLCLGYRHNANARPISRNRPARSFNGSKKRNLVTLRSNTLKTKCLLRQNPDFALGELGVFAFEGQMSEKSCHYLPTPFLLCRGLSPRIGNRLVRSILIFNNELGGGRLVFSLSCPVSVLSGRGLASAKKFYCQEKNRGTPRDEPLHTNAPGEFSAAQKAKICHSEVIPRKSLAGCPGVSVTSKLLS